MTNRSPAETARRIAFYIYVPIATVWILGTDMAVALTQGSTSLLWLNMAKGAGFAVVTGALLYLLVRRELDRREAQERDHLTLTENVPDLVFRLRLRPDLRFEYVSPSSVDVGGYSPQEYYADPGGILATVHSDDRGVLDALLTDMDSDLDQAELRWVHKDGRVVWTDIRVRKERDTEGRVVFLSGILRDVTAQRETRRMRSLLAKALEAAGESVVITDRDGIIEYVNRAFTEITGYDPEDAIGRTPRILKSGEQDESFYANLWSTIASGRTFRGVLSNRRADGRIYEQATSITPVRGADGKIEHFIAVARDITVQRALEKRLRFTEKMDAVGQLAAGVAHDFRNLLTVILVNAELLKAGSDREAVADRERPRDAHLDEVDQILISTRRGADLAARLLRLASQHDPDLRATDLAGMIRGMGGMFRAIVSDSVALEVRVPEGPLPVRIDADLLQDALINVVQNARQATAPGGRVLIEIHDTPAEEGAPVHITVRDNGTGMDEGTLAQIFDPFFTTKETGTGLGLPMVRGIVEVHGGSLEVQSKLDEGTSVTFILPVRLAGDEDVESPPDSESGAVPVDVEAGGGRVLLAEDDPRLRVAAERALRRLGYEVTPAENGRVALDLLIGAPEGWDLVLSDLVMPELGGLELYEEVQQRGWTIPFLFMSGHGPEAVAPAGGPDEAFTFLEKPWTMDTLRTTVRGAIDEGARPS